MHSVSSLLSAPRCRACLVAAPSCLQTASFLFLYVALVRHAGLSLAAPPSPCRAFLEIDRPNCLVNLGVSWKCIHSTALHSAALLGRPSDTQPQQCCAGMQLLARPSQPCGFSRCARPHLGRPAGVWRPMVAIQHFPCQHFPCQHGLTACNATHCTLAV